MARKVAKKVLAPAVSLFNFQDKYITVVFALTVLYMLNDYLPK